MIVHVLETVTRRPTASTSRATFGDPDEDPDTPEIEKPLAYSASTFDAAVVAVSMTASTLTPTPVSAGSALVTVTAADEAAEASHQFAVTVVPSAEAPPPRTLTGPAPAAP